MPPRRAPSRARRAAAPDIVDANAAHAIDTDTATATGTAAAGEGAADKAESALSRDAARIASDLDACVADYTRIAAAAAEIRSALDAPPKGAAGKLADAQRSIAALVAETRRRAATATRAAAQTRALAHNAEARQRDADVRLASAIAECAKVDVWNIAYASAQPLITTPLELAAARPAAS
jgi:hypothetical protein